MIKLPCPFTVDYLDAVARAPGIDHESRPRPDGGGLRYACLSKKEGVDVDGGGVVLPSPSSEMS